MDTEIETSSLPWVSAGRARGGRPTQQDELFCTRDPDTDTRLLVLADGMGGDGAGEIAAQGVVHIARELWDQRLWAQQPGALFLETLCQQAHEELRRRGEDVANGEPHSTVVALLIKDGRACWAHVGDSRLYHFRGGRCLARTEDHSLAQLKVSRGELRADQLASDPDQHKLLRGLGGIDAPLVEHGGAVLGHRQSFVLCSDGIWESLSTEELGALASRQDQDHALHEALALAVERGGADGDNAALIVVRIERESTLQQWKRKLGVAVWGRVSGHRADMTS